MTFQIMQRSPDVVTLFCNDCHLTLATWKASNPALEDLNTLAEEHRLVRHSKRAGSKSSKGIMLRKALPGDPRLV